MPHPYFNTNGQPLNFTGEVLAMNVDNYRVSGYYFLPYSDTQRVLIQYGRMAEVWDNTTNVTYLLSYATMPIVFLTVWGTYGTRSRQARINSWSVNGFSADMNPSPGYSNYGYKPQLCWISIGLYNF
jgi:hypothetical protein